MYPNELFLGMTLYDIFLLIGVIAAFLLADRLGIKRGFSVALQKTVIVGAFFCVVLGYFFAVLFQAFYNFLDGGAFEITQGTGATFFGGLLGGAGVFLFVWFVVAPRFCKDKEEPKKAVCGYFGYCGGVRADCTCVRARRVLFRGVLSRRGNGRLVGRCDERRKVRTRAVV